MPRMIAALFRDRTAAESALQTLIGSGIARDRIRLLGAGHDREVSSISGFRDLERNDEAAALDDLGLPPEDVAAFAQGLHRGGALLSARVDGSDFEEAIQVLELYDPIDLDRESEGHRTADPAGQGADAGAPLGAGLTAGGLAGSSNTAALPGMGAMADGTHDVGSTDLRTDDLSRSDQGRSTMPVSGDRRAEERAGAPGVLELGARGDAQLASKMAPGAEQTAGMGLDAKPDLFRRETNRCGRARAYIRD